MKRIIACAAVLMLLVSLCVPAMAAEAEFTPSVTNKPAPEIVPVVDPDGNPAIAVIRDADGNIIDYVYEDCLIITAVADAKASTEIPDAAEELLLDVYDKLISGEMQLPYEKHNAGLNAAMMVIRDLFDATFLCGEHPDMLLPDDVVLEITFNIGVEADAEVFVMSFNDQEWNPIVSCVNNGDGTVTCTFEHLCPIEFSVAVASEDDGPDSEGPAVTDPTEDDSSDDDTAQTGDEVGAQLYIWGLVALVALAAIVALSVVYRRGARKSE